jgi:ketosteroid isomerase-like protein
MTRKELFVEAMRRTDAHDYEGFLEMQAPDCAWRLPDGELHGRNAVRERLRVFWEGFSEDRHELTRIAEEGGTVYCEGVWHAVNTGAIETPEGTLPATGRPLALHFMMAVDIDAEARHATSVHLYFDQMEFLGALGLLPEPAAAQ